MSRIPCKRCGAMILEVTSNTNGGLCAPCDKGGGVCEKCGKRMAESNREGKYVCTDCCKAEELGNLAFLPQDWSKMEDVDWALIAKNYAMLGEDLIRLFRDVQGEDPVYGIVFQLSQNSILDLHINTHDGVREIPARMREIANWGKELSDEEWIGKVGIWYTPAWKYSDLGSRFQSHLNPIVDFHYDLFEGISGSLNDSAEWDLLSKNVNEARLSAIEQIKSSEVFAGILKYPDCAVHVVDDDGLDYYSKAHIGK